jgi:hypothetical protein
MALIRQSGVSFAQIFDMRVVLILLLTAWLAACSDDEKKPVEQQRISQNTAVFNRAVGAMLEAYYEVSEALVNWDSIRIIAASQKLDSMVKKIDLNELKDRADLLQKANLSLFKTVDASLSLGQVKDINIKRQHFHSLSTALFGFLSSVEFDEKSIYLQECPMAFNDTGTGVWLTDKGLDSIRNPYLGLHHPKYGKGMLECGGNKSVLNIQRK